MNTRDRRNQKATRNGLKRHAWKGPNGLRARTLQRDQHRCRLKLPGCTHKATSVHLAPLLRGDHTRATLDHCLSACHHCHGVIDGRRSKGGRVPAQTTTSIPDGSRLRANPKVANRFMTAVARRG